MPTRILRDGILDSEQVDRLSEPAELFYRRLMSVVDDFGRYECRYNLLASKAFPLRRNITEEDIKQRLEECIAAKLIRVYRVGDKDYLEILNFGQRIKTGQISKFPEPPGTSGTFPEVPVSSGNIQDIPASRARSTTPPTTTPTTPSTTTTGGTCAATDSANVILLTPRKLIDQPDGSEQGTQGATRGALALDLEAQGLSYDEFLLDYASATGVEYTKHDADQGRIEWNRLSFEQRLAARNDLPRLGKEVGRRNWFSKPQNYLRKQEWTAATAVDQERRKKFVPESPPGFGQNRTRHDVMQELRRQIEEEERQEIA